ncbi:MAG: hypothetical protein ACTHQQ_02495 [Solirubrobacteraceae bacterium]
MRSARDGLDSLALALREHGGTVADLVHDGGGDGDGKPGAAQLASAGPRAACAPGEYELLLEMILEGASLHYGPTRVVRTDDPDLALLVGDQLYALGLERLAALGDLGAVAELADTISLVAQAHAAGDRELADAVWEAGVIAVGWGGAEEFEEAKQLARAGDSRAVVALRSASRVAAP